MCGCRQRLKFVVIDSSLYTPEAFEYIQEFVNYAGSILFVSDTKKIYARGKYFGGDIFKLIFLWGDCLIVPGQETHLREQAGGRVKKKRRSTGKNNNDIHHIRHRAASYLLRYSPMLFYPKSFIRLLRANDRFWLKWGNMEDFMQLRHVNLW